MVSLVMVSIIIPLYNCEEFLPATIQSVLTQTFTDFECILVDDRSTDSTSSIAVRAAAEDNRIRLIKNNFAKGPAGARNTGIQYATGEFTAFLDSDDIWLPEKLARQIQWMQAHNAVLSFTAYRKINESGDLISSQIPVPAQVSYSKLLYSNVIGCSTAILHTSKCGKFFMPDLLKRQDFGLWLDITKTGITAYGINEVLAHYRVRENSVSSKKSGAVFWTWKLYRQQQKLSLLKALWYFGFNLLRASYKRFAY